jgi:hypothetical protein
LFNFWFFKAAFFVSGVTSQLVAQLRRQKYLQQTYIKTKQTNQLGLVGSTVNKGGFQMVHGVQKIGKS